MTYFKTTYKVNTSLEKIGGENVIRLLPEGLEGSLKTIIFYHGLGSCKENQRIRAFILASFGYQVFIPDSIYHGERNRLDETDDMEKVYRYFWKAILQSIEESHDLVDEIIDKYRADSKNIFVSGHSMGGYIASGIVANNEKVRAAFPINGSFNWEESNRLMKEAFQEDRILDVDLELKKYNPMNRLEALENKEILILHGQLDQEVDPSSDRKFYELVLESGYKNIEYREYEGVGHFTTTGMMEDIIDYLDKLKY